MSQRARRRAPRFATWGFKPIALGARTRLLAAGVSGAGHAKARITHLRRVAQLAPGERFTMEIGSYEGFRFITSPALS